MYLYSTGTGWGLSFQKMFSNVSVSHSTENYLGAFKNSMERPGQKGKMLIQKVIVKCGSEKCLAALIVFAQ